MMNRNANRTTMDMKKKILIVLLVCMIGFLAMICRVAYWQIIRGAEMSQSAIEQQTRDKTINSKRGSVLDRNGN